MFEHTIAIDGITTDTFHKQHTCTSITIPLPIIYHTWPNNTAITLHNIYYTV